jgi:hypothetical protein
MDRQYGPGPPRREQYLAGFSISRLLCAINLLTFTYLSYLPPNGSSERCLCALASLTGASGVPYALTFPRKTNGALSLWTHRVAGRQRDDPAALTHARGEKGSVEGEGVDVRDGEMVRRSRRHNDVRAVEGGLGVVLVKR